MSSETGDNGERSASVSPVRPTAAFLLMAVGRRVREQAESRLRERTMSMRHLAALGHLRRDPGCSYSELARRAGVTAQSMQATLRQLEDLDAVERRTPPGRGRTAELHVTPAGEALETWARSIIDGLDHELMTALPVDQREVFVDALMATFRNESTRVGADPPA